MSDTFGYGQQGPNDSSSEFNKIAFVVSQMMARLRTLLPVKVVAVTNEGGVSPVGSVDVLPLITQLDGQGNATPYAAIFGVPYFRLQGGTNAIIIDPTVNDVGFMIAADRDISSVKATKGPANPGSFRRFDLADGIYIGGILNDTPTQYVRCHSGGIDIVSPTKVTITAPIIDLVGAITVDGTVTGPGGAIDFGTSNLTTTGQVTGGIVIGGGKNLATHVHGGVQTGGGDTGPPV